MGKHKRKKERMHNICPAKSLREDAKGITNLTGSSGFTVTKMQHLQRLAVWAVEEASVPPLGAFFGARLAAIGEASGIPPPSTRIFACQRCETVLVPGLNCTIRVLKYRRKARHRPHILANSVNAVVRFCNFCSHKNMRPGSLKNHVKGITAEKTASVRKQTRTNKIGLKQTNRRAVNSPGLTSSPFSPNPSSTPASENASNTRKKRKRKCWSTVKELASSKRRFSNLDALKIPVFNFWGDKDSIPPREK